MDTPLGYFVDADDSVFVEPKDIKEVLFKGYNSKEREEFLNGIMENRS